MLVPNCDSALQPFSMTEDNELVFLPTERYRRFIGLERELPNEGSHHRTKRSSRSHHLSLAFRTLKESAQLLSMVKDSSITTVEIQDGSLVYRSSDQGKPEINMTSEVKVSDGNWHMVALEVSDDVLQMKVDHQYVGYKIEFSAVQNFLSPQTERFVIGNAHVEGLGEINLVICFWCTWPT